MGEALEALIVGHEGLCMTSPFPGMDPFIEAQKWSGFHNRIITELADQLVRLLRPRYEVEPEKRIYVETSQPEAPSFVADVSVSGHDYSTSRSGPAPAILELEPSLHTLPVPVEEREPYLVIRTVEKRRAVAVIEVLSPTNKRSGSDGRRKYLKKRNKLLSTRTHLVELDLLLGGMRLPLTPGPHPDTDYCAVVCRSNRRPRAELFEWTIRQRLPHIPIPLANGDPDAIVDLQAAFDAIYDRSGFDYTVNYDEPLGVEMRPRDREWFDNIVKTCRR